LQEGVEAGGAEEVEELGEFASMLGGREGRREGGREEGERGEGRDDNIFTTYRDGLNDGAALVVAGVVHCLRGGEVEKEGREGGEGWGGRRRRRES